MINPKLWKGNDLTGRWDVTIKLDGVRALIESGIAKSKHDKPLYNLNHISDGDYEIYSGSWEKSITAVRKQDGDPVPIEHAYSLDPLDDRLSWGYITNPSAHAIGKLLQRAVYDGAEGLVLRQGKTWLKVKPMETHDVVITGLNPGTGRNKGRLGAFRTDMGKVGTGLTDAMREEFWDEKFIGMIIEVECTSITPAGKFRDPRFKRMRYDK